MDRIKTYRFETHTTERDVVASLTIELQHKGPQIITAPPEKKGQIAPYQTTDHRMIEEYDELSVTGTYRDRYGKSMGQCIEEVAAAFPEDTTAQRIAALWREWHLNGMTAGCDHQGAEWTCTHRPEEHDAEISKLRAELNALYEQRAKSGDISTAEYRIKWAEEVRSQAHSDPVMNGWDIAKRMQSEGKAAPQGTTKLGGTSMLSKSYGFRGDSCVVCGRSRWDEPSDACPITGYRYGTRWLVRELPADILAEIERLTA